MLGEHPEAKVSVFAVWEPILLADWIPPTTGALGRLSDRRVAQFWDGEHTLAKAMAESRAGQPPPDCCDRSGTLWDLIARLSVGHRMGRDLAACCGLQRPGSSGGGIFEDFLECGR
jgi:hypothetical protein